MGGKRVWRFGVYGEFIVVVFVRDGRVWILESRGGWERKRVIRMWSFKWLGGSGREYCF